MTSLEIRCLEDLRGFRGAPPLSASQRPQLQAELRERVAVCDWCTIGVMAPAASAAWAALRRFEAALGWPPLAPGPEEEETEGPVFLKGHQRNGTVRLREEAGLGEGVLISGHCAANPAVEDTWGPFPLDFFADPRAQGPEGGATSL